MDERPDALTPTLSHGRGSNHKKTVTQGLPFCIYLAATGQQSRSVQFFRAVQPVTFERTLHVFNGVDDVMVNQFLVLNTDAAAAVAL